MFFVKNHANRNVFSAAFFGSESTLRVCAKQGLGLPEAMALSKENPCCRLCGLQVPQEDGRFHGPTFRCTICESSLRQIRRNMERSDLDGFSVEEQKTFFPTATRGKEETRRWPIALDHCAGLSDYCDDHSVRDRLQV